MPASDVRLTATLDGIDWALLARIFERAPLGTREPEALRKVFENSAVVCFAWHAGELVGCGRAISDRVRFAVIFDVVLLPEHQGQGIGTQIMQDLARRSGAQNILLHAARGKEAFYEKLGYRRMKTAMGLFADPKKQEQLGHI
jgi:aralkylamine N-acetyltransferase